MDHAVRATGNHDVRVAVADHRGGFADGLRTRGTRRQAGEVRPAQIELVRHVPGSRVHLDFEFVLAIEPAKRRTAKLTRVGFVTAGFGGIGDAAGEAVEVFAAFAGAEVDTEPRRVEAVRAE